MNNIEKLAIEKMIHEHAGFNPNVADDAETIKHIKNLLEAFAKALQQSSEPVAWLDDYSDVITDKRKKFLLENGCGDDYHIPLFTYPPASVPLGAYNKLLEALKEIKGINAQQQSEPVGEVVIHMIGANDVCAIQWMDGYKPKVGDLLFTHPPATVPEGYALVPIQPDSKYLTDVALAIGKLLESVGINTFDINEWCGTYNIAKTAHKAMLSASPTPPNAVPLEKYNKLLDVYKTIEQHLVDVVEILEGEGVYTKTVDKIRQAIAEAEGKEG